MDAVLAGALAFGTGLIAGLTLLVGAAIGWAVRVPEAVVAGIMAFGAGVLISALAFELVLEAHATGGIVPTMVGFVLGAVVYVAADAVIDARGRRGDAGRGRSGTKLLAGALIDGIPESVVLGASVAATGGISLPILVAIAISNVPEGLAGAALMKSAGRSGGHVVALWGAVAVVTGVASLLGWLALRQADPSVTAFITTIAAGGLLAMVCNTMIPDAFARDRAATGLLATLGFAAAFAISHAG